MVNSVVFCHWVKDRVKDRKLVGSSHSKALGRVMRFGRLSNLIA
jgi:hypothetical protein